MSLLSILVLALAALGAVLLLGALRGGNPALATLRAAGAGLWAFLVRWQEHSGWAPLCLVAALVAWAVLGALDRTAAIDMLAPLGMAPILALYAFLALGGTLLASKRARRKLSDEEQADYWKRVVGGTWRDGAVIVFLGEKIFALAVLAMLLRHFRVAS